MTCYSNINIRLEEEKSSQLKRIINDLFESGSINSNETEEFIRFTLFIVFDEYERNTSSLKKFYSMNLEKYQSNKKNQRQNGCK